MSGDNEQCRGMWARLMDGAIDDLRNGTTDDIYDAIVWIRDKSEEVSGFAWVCETLGLDPDIVAERAEQIIGGIEIINPWTVIVEALDTAKMTLTEIVQASGAPSRFVVQSYLKRMGQPWIRRPRMGPEEVKRRLEAVRDIESMTVTQIHKATKIPKSTLWTHFRQNGTPHRAVTDKTPSAAGLTKEWML